MIPDSCTQNQFDALADFTYNEGARSLAVLLSHGWTEVTTQLPRWCWETVNGVLARSAVLLDRRQKEIAMFDTLA
jgi:GH24 family phage-related lysozyme (muramidase)